MGRFLNKSEEKRGCGGAFFDCTLGKMKDWRDVRETRATGGAAAACSGGAQTLHDGIDRALATRCRRGA
jgi:hypothetical protein